MDDVLVVSVVDHECVAGPSAHLFDDEVRNSSDKQISGATGTKRMPRVVVSWETKTLGDELNTGDEGVVGQ